MIGNLCIPLTSSKFSWVAAATCQSLKHYREAPLNVSILTVAPGHTSCTDCMCFAQLTFWSLKVIHMRGVNAFSISCRAAVNSWSHARQPARAGSPPFNYPTTVATPEAPKSMGRWWRFKYPQILWGSCHALGCYNTAMALRWEGVGGRGSWAQVQRRQQWHKDLLQTFPEVPAWPVGTLLLTALALVSSRKHLEL